MVSSILKRIKYRRCTPWEWYAVQVHACGYADNRKCTDFGKLAFFVPTLTKRHQLQIYLEIEIIGPSSLMV